MSMIGTRVLRKEDPDLLTVVAVVTAADLELAPTPPGMPMLNQQMLRTDLATGRVRYVGEPIVAVSAETREEAVDASCAT